MPSIRFSHVALNCKSIAATEEFYSRYFNFRRARVIDLGKTQIVFLKSGNVYLELFQAEGASTSALPTNDGYVSPGVRHLAFQVDNVDVTLAAMGNDARLTQGPMNFDAFIPGWRTVWISDPDGNIVEISQGFTDQSPTAVVQSQQATSACQSLPAR